MTMCECCGHPVPDNVARFRLTKTERRLYDMVVRSGRAGVSVDAVVDALYGDRVDGGPLTARAVVCTVRCHMNTKMKPHGFAIKSFTRSYPPQWRMELLE